MPQQSSCGQRGGAEEQKKWKKRTRNGSDGKWRKRRKDRVEVRG